MKKKHFAQATFFAVTFFVSFIITFSAYGLLIETATNHMLMAGMEEVMTMGSIYFFIKSPSTTGAPFNAMAELCYSCLKCIVIIVCISVLPFLYGGFDMDKGVNLEYTKFGVVAGIMLSIITFSTQAIIYKNKKVA